ncbi:DUF6308 family protein [Litorihabitans aurantiacus]|uniref:Uncharacterized protein n=1 Tax=Litorihabitans aurantiacus TaxID=1930061 RepID=A0AA37XHC1_9MICO|nr:hypothetical protein GCM10025875_31900 [Litorihabitans aurantiacus]
MSPWTRPSILSPSRQSDARRHLLRYFAGSDYSGSYFEEVGGDRVDPNRVTSEDLVALAMLSVPVQGAAARELLGGGPALRSRAS